jgi:alpha-beta hydrolase superfamily lysophospholipase
MANATQHLAPAPRPVTSFDEAMARVKALQAKDGPDVRDDSRTWLWSQGKKAEHVLVYYHGYTNAPPQFKILGEDLCQQGYNVLVARLPQHGLKDPLTTEQAKMTAEDMAALTQETVDIAQGLGEKVTIAGLSAGGVMAAWAAQFRSDVDLAVVMGPAFGLPVVPSWVSSTARSAIGILPNSYIWWDPRVKEKIVGPAHAYPRFSTKGLAETFRLGNEVRAAAKSTKPAARQIQVILSDFDTAIHLPTAKQVAEQWKKQGANVSVYTFAKDLKIWHDMIDPEQSTQQIDVVYPVVLPLLTQNA